MELATIRPDRPGFGEGHELPRLDTNVGNNLAIAEELGEMPASGACRRRQHLLDAVDLLAKPLHFAQ